MFAETGNVCTFASAIGNKIAVAGNKAESSSVYKFYMPFPETGGHED